MSFSAIVQGKLVIVLYMSADCSRSIDSRQHKSGSFHSPNYPDHYPPDVVCRYTFQGHGRERVQLVFQDFRLRCDAGVNSAQAVARKLAPQICIKYSRFILSALVANKGTITCQSNTSKGRGHDRLPN